MKIRPVQPEDIPNILEIYTEAVLYGTASWEIAPPNLGEMQQRVQKVLEGGYPYLVATIDDCVVGYTYASSYRPRVGYRFTCENSVYVDKNWQGMGIGKQLLTSLIQSCSEKGYKQMIAIIGDSANVASIRLHQAMGFERVGLLPKIGYKFDRWLDSVMMQRALSS
jgi:phosphinothricin acetyltransferase